MSVGGYILWIILIGSGNSQQAAFFSTMEACEAAKVQMVQALKPKTSANIVAECLDRLPPPK